jgi:Flp pilus assembly protein TadG
MRASSATLRRCLRASGGAAAVEFALVLPALITAILGIWYLGWSFDCGSEVGHAVELGSRIYISNPNATQSQLQTAVASHLTDLPIGAVTLTTSTATIGTAQSQHITWAYSTTPDIPFISAIHFNFTGAVDVPLATP